MFLAEDLQNSHLKQLERGRRQRGRFAELNFETSPQLCFRCQRVLILKENYHFFLISIQSCV